MKELDLPKRIFQTGFKPSGRKRITSNNLRWIKAIKKALSDEQHEMLADSKFRTEVHSKQSSSKAKESRSQRSRSSPGDRGVVPEITELLRRSQSRLSIKKGET
ncbi:hypothetical protein YC2023_074992 [Brassica napus]